MTQQLDSFSKILLATSAINYMAASINGVNRDTKWLKQVTKDADFDKIHGEGIQQRVEMLAEVVNDLKPIMEKMGNLINAQDAICPIDEYITTPAFEVLIQGHDNVEGNFDGL